MKIRDLIPKDKGDIASTENLSEFSFMQVEAIIPELLSWIQDLHWPASQNVFRFLKTNRDNITEDIICVLNDNDGIWKYNCLLLFADAVKIDKKLIEVIERIAFQPNTVEIEDDVQEIALEIIKKLKE
ncbi:MAG: DUF5071 domain-containing protein [Flavobacteriales bacterium]|nr:DUF5071 domain-containing protein [Flavobacteriales bacterium]